MPPALAIDRTSWLVGTALPSAFLEFIAVSTFYFACHLPEASTVTTSPERRGKYAAFTF